MDTIAPGFITVQATINAPVETVWELWTSPEHITRWNAANDEWHTPRAENDLRAGGKFLSRMEAKDGSMGFDFGGVYETVKNKELIEYVMGDGRKAIVVFRKNGNLTTIEETFQAEQTNSPELQRSGWQAILDNFKKYTEAYHLQNS